MNEGEESIGRFSQSEFETEYLDLLVRNTDLLVRNTDLLVGNTDLLVRTKFSRRAQTKNIWRMNVPFISVGCYASPH